MRGSACTQCRSPQQVTSTYPHPRAGDADTISLHWVFGWHMYQARSALDLEDLQQRQRCAQKDKAAQADGTRSISRKAKIFFSERRAFVTNINPGLPPLLILVITLHLHFSFTAENSQILLRINIEKGLFAGLKATVSGAKFQDHSSGTEHRKN